MSNQAIASYLPDFQLIKLGLDLPAFCDPDDPRGFVGPHEISYFFHEWLHYLHNASTIHGLSAFANLVHLWTLFRSSIGSDGLSRGSSALGELDNVYLKQKIAFSEAARASRRNFLASSVVLSAVEVTKVDFVDLPLPELTLTTRIISCGLQIRNAGGDYYSAQIQIGPHEIVESVAYMLEERLTRKFGAEPRKIEFSPYFLLKALASYVSPNLSDDCVIACGLASLQASNPPTDLLDILKRAESEKLSKGNVLDFLISTQSKILRDAKEWIDERLAEINGVFCADEPMARAVRKTVETLRRNFEARRTDPFFELSLVDRIASNYLDLTAILQEFGACGLLQQRPGYEDDVERDLIYEFVLDSDDNSELNEGRRIMHAAFRFVGLHSGDDGSLQATSQIAETRKNMCPFYNVCPLDARKIHPENCAEKPWVWAAPSTANLCWYAQGVRKASPPNIAAKLAEA